MQNLFTKKFIPILLIIFTCFLLFLSSKVLAASYDLSDYENHIGSNSWLIAYDETNNIFYLFVASGSGKNFIGGIKTVDDVNYINYGVACSASSGSYWNSVQCDYSVYTFDSSASTFINPEQHTPSSHFYFSSNMLFIASNTNYYNWENPTPFFQATPVPSVVYIQPLTLAEELEKVETVEVFKKLMKNVVVSLVVCLVGFLSLRKGWTFLKKDLKKA